MSWQDKINTVWQGDCLELMKEMPDKCIDLVVTDPPYGIGVAKKGTIGNANKKNYRGINSRQYGNQTWDSSIPNKIVFEEIFRVSRNQVIFGGNYFVKYLSNSPCWLVWDKKEHDKSKFADCELAWTSFNSAIRKFKFGWVGLDAINNSKNDHRFHPTQKPLPLIKWVIEKYSKKTDLVFDPFMGSWTTARACMDLGRNFIGAEVSAEYCEIGRQRLRQQVLI